MEIVDPKLPARGRRPKNWVETILNTPSPQLANPEFRYLEHEDPQEQDQQLCHHIENLKKATLMFAKTKQLADYEKVMYFTFKVNAWYRRRWKNKDELSLVHRMVDSAKLVTIGDYARLKRLPNSTVRSQIFDNSIKTAAAIGTFSKDNENIIVMTDREYLKACLNFHINPYPYQKEEL